MTKRITLEDEIHLFGLKLYSVQCKLKPEFCYEIYAKSPTNAWRKFVAIRFRKIPVKPCRQDWIVSRSKKPA